MTGERGIHRATRRRPRGHEQILSRYADVAAFGRLQSPCDPAASHWAERSPRCAGLCAICLRRTRLPQQTTHRRGGGRPRSCGRSLEQERPIRTRRYGLFRRSGPVPGRYRRSFSLGCPSRHLRARREGRESRLRLSVGRRLSLRHGLRGRRSRGLPRRHDGGRRVCAVLPTRRAGCASDPAGRPSPCRRMRRGGRSVRFERRLALRRAGASVTTDCLLFGRVRSGRRGR